MKRYCKMFPILPCKSRQYFLKSRWSNLVSGGAPSVARFAYSFLSTLTFLCLSLMIHSSPLSLRSIPPPLNLISYPSHYVPPPPSSPILLLNGTHWPWLICCVWLNERSFTYLITMATGINDRWPLGRNTEVLKKKNPESVTTLLDIPPLHCVPECVV